MLDDGSLRSLLSVPALDIVALAWSLRQYNYACALVGAMPASLAPGRQPALSDPAGRVLTLAVINFNGGLRAYYFALAVLSWLVHPVLFMIVSAWMLLVLVRRQ